MAEQATQGTIDPKVKKDLEFVAQWAEATPHLAGMMEKDFEQNPEGKLVAYLKRTVLEGYSKDIMSFLQHIMAGEPGRRGIHGLIHYIENPTGGEAKDADLAKSLKKVADEIEKAKLPDINELRHFKALEEALRKMPAGDMNDFKAQFEQLLARATAYPEASATTVIVENSSEKMPKRIAMEHYKSAIAIWKMVFSKLVLPPLKSPELSEVEEKIAKKVGKSVDEFRKATGMPNEHETDGWDNLAALKKMGKNSLLSDLFEKLGQKAVFEELLIHKINSMNREQFLHELKGAIDHLSSKGEIEKVEMAATKESAELIEKMIVDMEKAVKSEHDRFVKVITRSIEDIEKKHAKKLNAVEEMKKEEEEASHNLLMHTTLATQDIAEIEKINDSVKGYEQRILEITSIIFARLRAQDFAEGIIDREKLASELNSMMMNGLNNFFLDEIRKIRDAASKTPEEFNQAMARADKVVEQLKAQIPQINNGMMMHAEKEMRVATEYDGLRDGSEYWLHESSRLARDHRRRLSPIDLDHESYYEDFSDDERNYLGYN